MSEPKQVYECLCPDWKGYSTTVAFCPYCGKPLKLAENFNDLKVHEMEHIKERDND